MRHLLISIGIVFNLGCVFCIFDVEYAILMQNAMIVQSHIDATWYSRSCFIIKGQQKLSLYFRQKRMAVETEFNQ